MKKYTNYILRLEMLNVGVEVFLAALISDVIIPHGVQERQLQFSLTEGEGEGVVCLRLPLSDEDAQEITKKLEHVPEELICFDHSEGMANVSVVLRKMNEEESELMLEILMKEWNVRCSVLDERENNKSQEA